MGSRGYAFQEAYVVTQIPAWLADESFRCLVLEGAGDVDVLFCQGGQKRRWYIQVKDHRVALTELRGVLSEFGEKDRASPGTFVRFVLACPGLSREAESFRRALEEYRGLREMYDANTDRIMANTRAKLQGRVERLGLSVDLGFLVGKVWLDSALPDLSFEPVCRALFIDRLQRMEQWQRHTQPVIDPVFDHLVTFVRSSVRQTRTREDVKAEITTALERTRAATSEDSAVIWLHNWVADTFDCKPDYVLDWTRHFDRSCRRVPSQSVWQEELLPALADVRRGMLESVKPKLIRLRGKACLSAGIAFGNAFPRVGGYVVEVQQAGQSWRSDAAPAPGYRARVSREDGNDRESADLLVLVNVTGDAGPQVQDYASQSGLRYRAKVTISPAGALGDHSMGTAGEAVALAAQVKEAIRTMRDSQRAYGTAHLFVFGPLGLAVVLGHMLTASGSVQCYEHRDPGYEPSCLLTT